MMHVASTISEGKFEHAQGSLKAVLRKPLGAFLLTMLLGSGAFADDAAATADEAPSDDIPTVLDVTPAGIELVIGFNRLGEAIDRSYALNEELGMNSGPNDFRDRIDDIIGDDVVDFAGPATLFALTGFETENLDITRLGAALFVQDPKSARVTLGTGEMLPDEYQFLAQFAEPSFELPAAFRQRVVYFSLGADSLKEIFSQPSLASELDPVVVERLNAADVIAVAQRGPMLDELWQGVFPPAPLDEAATDDEQLQLARQVQQLAGSIEWMTFAGAVAFSADDPALPTGTRFGFSAMCDHASDSETAALLEQMSNDSQPTTFDGLPEGDAVVAFAGRLDGSNHIGIVRYVAAVAFQLWNGTRGLPDSLIGEQFLSIFEEAGEHLQGGRLAIYRNSDHAAHGRFAVVVIFDTDDPQAFLAEMRQLVRLASADEVAAAAESDAVTDDEIRALVQELGDRLYRVRRGATNRLMLIGPRAIPFLQEGLEAESLELRTRARVILEQIEALNTYESRHFLGSDLFQNLEIDQRYVIAGEHLADGTPVDLITTSIVDEAEQPFAQRLASWLGPDWNRWRMAATDRQIVLVLGSHDGMLEQTLDNLRGTGVAQLQVPEWQEPDQPHQFELHVDVQAFLPADAAGEVDSTDTEAALAERDLVSVGLAFARDTIQVDVFVPKSQLPVGGWPFVW